jgi:hypothetical protein
VISSWANACLHRTDPPQATKLTRTANFNNSRLEEISIKSATVVYLVLEYPTICWGEAVMLS